MRISRASSSSSGLGFVLCVFVLVACAAAREASSLSVLPALLPVRGRGVGGTGRGHRQDGTGNGAGAGGWPPGVGSSSTRGTPSAVRTALGLYGGATAAASSSLASAGLLATINTFYKTYPVLASFGTCSVKGCIADMIAQRQNKASAQEKFSLRRNAAYIFYSGIFLGLGSELIYNHVHPPLFGEATRASVILGKVLFDNFVCAPLIWLPPAYFVKAILYGKDLRWGGRQYIEDVTHKGLLREYWKVWVPMQSINFSIVPLHLRVSVMAGTSLFWLTILSCISSNK